MTDREHLYSCVECCKPIYQGDKYQPAGEENFCPDHAATLSDALKFWEHDITNEAFPCWRDEFDSIEDARAHLDDLREQIERDGADFKRLYEA